MTRDDVRDAAQEAKRFLRLVAAWQKRMGDDDCRYYSPPSVEGGALRRASMDLTRALAKMRRTRT